MRVLIVDDDDLFGGMLADRLRRDSDMACVAQAVASAEQAVITVESDLSLFDVFLIDYRLGVGPDGIELMKSLRQLNPDADAIIFTGVDDGNVGLVAYQYGAYRYLPKPFDPRELSWILRSLQEKRRTQHELNWLSILNQIVAKLQRCLTYEELAGEIVRGGQLLGFSRVRLWHLSPDGRFANLIRQAGCDELEKYTPVQLEVSTSPYLQETVRSHDLAIFHGRSRGPTHLDLLVGGAGFHPADEDWVNIPLWHDDRCIGLVALDNVHNLVLRSEQKEILKLFGKQVVAAYTRTQHFEWEKRRRAELAVLNRIGRKMSDQAALDDLETLLEHIRKEIGRLIDVQNFMVVLVDEENQHLEVRLQYVNGRLSQKPYIPGKNGMIAHVIQANKRLFLPNGTQDYREQHGILLQGKPARSWMAATLQMEGKAIGAIIMENDEEKGAYDQGDYDFLCAVADQVAGVIQSAKLKEKESRAKSQLAVLHQASEVIMNLAEENEEWMWYAVLTVTTADYALGFNRAMSFLWDENGNCLRGQMGIGHFEEKDARRDWQQDKKNLMDFNKYLALIRSGKVKKTPIQKMIERVVLPLTGENNILAQILSSGKRAVLSAQEAAVSLPTEFTKPFGITEYVLMPLQGGGRVIGVVILDNVYNREPISRTKVDYLEPILAQAVLISRNLRERRVRDQLIDLNHRVLAQAPRQKMSQTLAEICRAAQMITNADFVVINPLKSSERPFEFDKSHLCGVGKTGELYTVPLPRPNGITEHILRAGALVVHNIQNHPTQYNGELLSQNSYMQNKGIQSFIGTPIRDLNSGEALGVLYLKYTWPQKFSEKDLQYANLFAGLTAVAILNTQTAEKARNQNEAQQRELRILSRVLEESLTFEPDELKISKALLTAAAELLHRPEVRIGLVLREWYSPNDTNYRSRRYEIRRKHVLQADGTLYSRTEGNVFRGICGLALQENQPKLVDDVTQPPWAKYYILGFEDIPTRAELDVPITYDGQVIGAFNFESPHVAAFSQADLKMCQRVAFAAGLALSNSRRQANLRMVLSATQAVTAATKLEDTLESLAYEARKAAPQLSLLTIYYRVPGTNTLKLGLHVGTQHEKALKQTVEMENKTSTVWRVMQSQEPIWVPDMTQENPLKGPFVKTERIKSSAAFPLRADNEVVGVMFLNYCDPHTFSSEEKALLSVLAQTVAATVRDAIHVEAIRKERHRQEVALGIAKALATTLDLDDTLRKIMDLLIDLFPDTKPVVLTYDPAKRQLAFTPASFKFYPLLQSPQAHRQILPVDGISLVCEAARRSLGSKRVEILNVSDVRQHPNYLNVVPETQSQLCITMMSSEDVLSGVLVLESPVLDAFKLDEAFILTVGHQIGVAIDRAQKNSDLRFKTTVATATAWAAEIAHDINREVGKIRNWTYWIQKGVNEKTDIWQWAKEIDDSVERLAGAMVAANTDYWGQTQQNPFLLDAQLKQWFQQVADKRNPGVDLRFELQCPNLLVKIQRDALKRVVRHLAHNALDAMQKTYSPQLLVRTFQPSAGWAELLVEDNGTGITPQVRQKIFQECITTKVGERRGFGLLLVRSLIEQIGGWIELLPSEPNGGAIFRVTLPVTSLNYSPNGKT